MLPLNLFCFLFYRGSLTWTGAFMYRLFRLREYKMIFLQLFLYPYVAWEILRSNTWTEALDSFLIFVFIKSTFVVLAVARNAWINWWCWRHRPDIQASALVVLLSGFLELFLSVCATWGRWKCLLFYIPLVPMRTGLVTRLPEYEQSRRESNPTSETRSRDTRGTWPGARSD